MAKQVTREQAERKKAQAVEFMEHMGEPGRADEFDDMSVEEYAEHRGLELVSSPRRKARKTNMATKAELQEQLDGIADVLNEAYTPESTREGPAAAVGEALDILKGEDEDDDSETDEEDDDPFRNARLPAAFSILAPHFLAALEHFHNNHRG